MGQHIFSWIFFFWKLSVENQSINDDQRHLLQKKTCVLFHILIDSDQRFEISEIVSEFGVSYGIISIKQSSVIG